MRGDEARPKDRRNRSRRRPPRRHRPDDRRCIHGHPGLLNHHMTQLQGDRVFRNISRRLRIVPLVSAFLVVALLTTTPGAGANAGSADDLSTIYSFAPYPPSFNGVSRGWANGVEQAAAELEGEFDVVLKWTGALENDPAAYMNFVQTAMLDRPDGVVWLGNDATANSVGLNDLKERYPDV